MDPVARERALQLFAVVVVTTALAGLFSGFRDRVAPSRPRGRSLASHPALGRAPTYSELQARFHPNRVRHAGNLEAMAPAGPNPNDPVPTTDAPERLAALERRAQRRAYDGAPPTIPHPVPQRDAPPCLTCHARGMDVGGRIAPAMPHGELGNCLQCHVVSEQPMPGALADLTQGPPLDNGFEGLRPPAFGERAWPVAPPTMPHPTRMRERCGACHGTLSAGLRSTHPWRESCTQCHAPSAALDQRPWALREATP